MTNFNKLYYQNQNNSICTLTICEGKFPTLTQVIR